MHHRDAAVATPGGRTPGIGATLRAGSRRLKRAETLALGACALLICALYFWTAFSSPSSTGYYDLLADAFLDGNTYLPVEPSPELLALDDPYDPAQNAALRLHDASLFEGRYYLYFGPAPVLLVHLPLRLVGVEADDALAGALLSAVGFLFALALMRFLIQRYRPQTSLATRVAAALLLGLANAAPFLMRRPAAYEVAIAGGYCCLLAGLHLTLTGALRPRPSIARLAGGSLALGLAVASRPHLVLALPVFIWAWAAALRSGRSAAGRWPTARVLAWSTVPLAACLIALAIYNLARFGEITEFGSSYQLAGINTGELDRFDLSRLVPGLFFYLLAPPRLDVVFPFAHLAPSYPGTLSPEYAAGIEPVAGAFATTAPLVLALAAPVVLLLGRRAGRESMSLASLLLLAALLVMAVPLLGFDGATMRYEMDWLTPLMLAALLVWLRLRDVVAPRAVARAATATVGAVAVLAAAFFGLAFSITGYGDGLRTASPGAYDRLERAFGWVPTLAARLRGEPVLLEVTPPALTDETRIRVAAPGPGVVDLRAGFDWNPVLLAGSLVDLRVQGSDGVTRRLRLVTRDTTIRAGFDGSGLQDVRIQWDLVRPVLAPEDQRRPPAGFAVVGARVVGWTPR